MDIITVVSKKFRRRSKKMMMTKVAYWNGIAGKKNFICEYHAFDQTGMDCLTI